MQLWEKYRQSWALYLLVGVVFVCQAKTIAPSVRRRPPQAPLPAHCGRQAGVMMARGGRALESSPQSTWLTHAVRRCLVQAHEATAVVPSIMTMDESIARWQGTPRVQQRLTFVPEHSRINISSILSLYNTSFASVDRHDALVVSPRQGLPEDVLR